jgi:hypothetical protein
MVPCGLYSHDGRRWAAERHLDAPWIEHLDIAGAILTEPIRPADGAITARGPGLGMDWDEAAVTRFAA